MKVALRDTAHSPTNTTISSVIRKLATNKHKDDNEIPDNLIVKTVRINHGLPPLGNWHGQGTGNARAAHAAGARINVERLVLFQIGNYVLNQISATERNAAQTCKISLVVIAVEKQVG